MSAGVREVEALGRAWKLVFDFNAMCNIEETYDRPFMQVVSRLFPTVKPEDMTDAEKVAQAAMSVRFTDLRAILRAALNRHQPDATGETAGDIVQALGMEAAIELVAWAVKAAVGEGKQGESPRPPRRGGKTG